MLVKSVLFASLAFGFIGSFASASTVLVRTQSVIMATKCGPGESSMYLVYQANAFGLNAATTKAYLTFNGRPVAAIPMNRSNNEQYLDAHAFVCDQLEGSGDVGIYFSDARGNKDDDFGKGFHFTK